MIGDEIRKERLRLGWSQETLAAKAGVHRTYIGLIERNRKSPTLQTYCRICKALGVSGGKVLCRLEKKQVR